MGATGASAKIEPRESCGVCHDSGSAYGVDSEHALTGLVAVSAPVFTKNGAAVDPCNTTIGAGKPLFHLTPAGAVLDGAPTLLRTCAQGDDFILGKSTAAAACTSCHQSTDSKGHAYQNGWVPTTFENGRQTILDTK